MKHTSAELKRLSREQLSGHWGIAIGANLLMQMITSALLMPFYFLLILTGGRTVQYITYMIAVFIIAAVSIVIQCGILRMYFGFARGREISIGMMFSEFSRRPFRYMLGYLLLILIDTVCVIPGTICFSVGLVAETILAVVIGVALYLVGTAIMLVLALRFSQVFIIMLEHSEVNVIEAFRMSAELMEGNMGRLFYIELSFIGWTLLGLLSCGIGMLWVTPYMMQVTVNFYRELTGELDKTGNYVDVSR